MRFFSTVADTDNGERGQIDFRFGATESYGAFNRGSLSGDETAGANRFFIQESETRAISALDIHSSPSGNLISVTIADGNQVMGYVRRNTLTRSTYRKFIFHSTPKCGDEYPYTLFAVWM